MIVHEFCIHNMFSSLATEKTSQESMFQQQYLLV